MKLNRNSLRDIILQEIKLFENCAAAQAGDEPCSACVKGGSCSGHTDHGNEEHASHGSDDGRMTKKHLYMIMKYATMLHDMIDDNEDLPEWLQSKVTRAAEKLSGAFEYLDSSSNQPESLGHM